MLWKGQRQSGNIEDQRGGGMSGGGKLLAGGGIGTLVLALLAMLFGKNPMDILGGTGNEQGYTNEAPAGVPQNDEGKQFVATVLAETEDVWTDQFQQMGKQYEQPTLVLFRDGVQSGCGQATSETGPFYCPLDHKVYLDLGFFDELSQRFGADGDFARAYVIAHEVGHHVQNLLGVSDKVHNAQERGSKAEANRLSVMLELQADFYAGVWAHHTQKMKKVLEAGDLEEALNAAQAIGDDRLQQQSQGYVRPETFTHGTSQQRAYWFKKGFGTSRPAASKEFTLIPMGQSIIICSIFPTKQKINMPMKNK